MATGIFTSLNLMCFEAYTPVHKQTSQPLHVEFYENLPVLHGDEPSFIAQAPRLPSTATQTSLVGTREFLKGDDTREGEIQSVRRDNLLEKPTTL